MTFFQFVGSFKQIETKLNHRCKTLIQVSILTPKQIGKQLKIAESPLENWIRKINFSIFKIFETPGPENNHQISRSRSREDSVSSLKTVCPLSREDSAVCPLSRDPRFLVWGLLALLRVALLLLPFAEVSPASAKRLCLAPVPRAFLPSVRA